MSIFGSIQRAMRGWRRRTSVIGHVRGIEGVRTPIEGVACVLSWTAIIGTRLQHPSWGREVELIVANDFLLVTPERIVQVRVAGATFRHMGLAWERLPAAPLRPDLAAAVHEAGIGVLHHYAELSLHDGDPIEVRGTLREEPAFGALQSGYRDVKTCPTLSAGEGRLEIRSHDVYRTAPMKRGV